MVYIPYKIIPIVFGIFAIVAQYVRIRLYMDYDKEVLNHAPGKCHLVKGIDHGSEDMTLLPGGKVIITSGAVGYSNQHLPCFENIVGQIYMFDMNTPDQPAVSLEIEGFDTENFNPLGISHYQHSGNPFYFTIMVTNPQPTGDTVEKFLLNTANTHYKLKHKQTIKDTEFGRLHGIACINNNDFYVTNTWYSNKRLGLLLEQFFWVKWGLIQLYENSQVSIVARDLFFASGISLSEDGKFVYITESLAGKFKIYKRHTNNRLFINDVYKVKSNPNNIAVSQNSNEVFLGSHPTSWSLLEHSIDIHKPTPSQVLRLIVENGKVQSLTEVYSDDGHRLWGSSSALRFRGGPGKDGLLIGTIHHKMAYCIIEKPFRV